MIEAIRRAVPIVATGLVAIIFLGAGYFIGEAKRNQNSLPEGRFQRISDTEAFDTYTAKNCLIVVHIPGGYKLDGPEPACSELLGR